MKVLKKVRYDNGIRKIYIFGLLVCSYTKKIKIKKTTSQIWQNLHKYKHVLLNRYNETNLDNNYKNVIWQVWLQGADKAPYIVQKCLESVQRHSGGRPVIVLDEQQIQKFIDIPKHISDKHKSGIISNAHFCDFVRVALLKKYGGTWIDATVFLTDNIPEQITDSKFFVFRSKQWMNFHQGMISEKYLYALTSDMFRGYNFFLSSSNWFIHSKGNSHIINHMYDLLTEYWKKEDKLIDYFFFHYFVTLCVVHNQECANEYFQMPTISNLYPHVMQSVIAKEFDAELYQEIQNNCFAHKLTYKQVPEGCFLESVLN